MAARSQQRDREYFLPVMERRPCNFGVLRSAHFRRSEPGDLVDPNAATPLGSLAALNPALLRSDYHGLRTLQRVRCCVLESRFGQHPAQLSERVGVAAWRPGQHHETEPGSHGRGYTVLVRYEFEKDDPAP